MDECIAKPAQIGTLRRVLSEMVRVSTCREDAERRGATTEVSTRVGSASEEPPDSKGDDNKEEVVPPAAKRPKYAVA